jgi:hypothetical protein
MFQIGKLLYKEVKMIDEVRDRYDELEMIVETLTDLSDDIKIYKDIMEQLDEIKFNAMNEMENVGKELEKLEEAENRELEYEYERSRI